MALAGPYRSMNEYSRIVVYGPTVKVGHTETHTPTIAIFPVSKDDELTPQVLADLITDWMNRRRA